MLNAIFTWILNNISSVATIAIAVLTFFYVRATKAMVVEMKEARKEQQRPYIIVDLAFRDIICDMVIKNIGNGAAKCVKITATPNVVIYGGTRLSELPLFKNGIEFFPSNKEIKFFFGTGPDLFKEGNPRRFNVELKYEDFFGNSYNENIVLDLSVYENLAEVSEKGIPAIHKDLEDIRRDLQKGVREVETVARIFKEGLRLVNYEFAVIPKEANTNNILKGKIEECINLWNSVHYQGGYLNSNKLYALRHLGSLMVSLASNCPQLEHSQKDKILKIAQKIEETNDLLRVLGRADEFKRSGEELVTLCKEALSSF